MRLRPWDPDDPNWDFIEHRHLSCHDCRHSFDLGEMVYERTESVRMNADGSYASVSTLICGACHEREFGAEE